MTLTGAVILLGSLAAFLVFMAVKTLLLGVFRERVLQFLLDEGVGSVVHREIIFRHFPRRKVVRELHFLSKLSFVSLHYDEVQEQYWKITQRGINLLKSPS